MIASSMVSIRPISSRLRKSSPLPNSQMSFQDAAGRSDGFARIDVQRRRLSVAGVCGADLAGGITLIGRAMVPARPPTPGVA